MAGGCYWNKLIASHWRAHAHAMDSSYFPSLHAYLQSRSLFALRFQASFSLSNCVSSIDSPLGQRLNVQGFFSGLATLRHVDSITGLLWHVATKKEYPRLDPSNPHLHDTIQDTRLSAIDFLHSAHDSCHFTLDTTTHDVTAHNLPTSSPHDAPLR